MEDILKDGGVSEIYPIPQRGANSEIDEELEEILKRQSARIKVVGVGGAGGNTVSRMREIGIKGGEIIAINTDAQDLLYANADQKILIGRELSKGLGAGSNPRIGAEAAKEQQQEIKKKLANSDLVFVTCGLGGGTGGRLSLGDFRGRKNRPSAVSRRIIYNSLFLWLNGENSRKWV